MVGGGVGVAALSGTFQHDGGALHIGRVQRTHPHPLSPGNLSGTVFFRRRLGPCATGELSQHLGDCSLSFSGGYLTLKKRPSYVCEIWHRKG